MEEKCTRRGHLAPQPTPEPWSWQMKDTELGLISCLKFVRSKMSLGGAFLTLLLTYRNLTSGLGINLLPTAPACGGWAHWPRLILKSMRRCVGKGRHGEIDLPWLLRNFPTLGARDFWHKMKAFAMRLLGKDEGGTPEGWTGVVRGGIICWLITHRDSQASVHCMN